MDTVGDNRMMRGAVSLGSGRQGRIETWSRSMMCAIREAR